MLQLSAPILISYQYILKTLLYENFVPWKFLALQYCGIILLQCNLQWDHGVCHPMVPQWGDATGIEESCQIQCCCKPSSSHIEQWLLFILSACLYRINGLIPEALHHFRKTTSWYLNYKCLIFWEFSCRFLVICS